jgi:hypothetical protein
MRNLKLIFVGVFVLTLASGVVAGMLVSRIPAVRGIKSTQQHLLLGDELQLNADQHEKMRDIWEGTRDVVDECFQQARAYQKERDEKFVGLLTEQQKAEYAKINDDYVGKINKLNDKRTAAFKDAVQKTKELLTEPQRKRYEEILKDRLGHDAPGGPPPPWLDAGDRTGPGGPHLPGEGPPPGGPGESKTH